MMLTRSLGFSVLAFGLAVACSNADLSGSHAGASSAAGGGPGPADSTTRSTTVSADAKDAGIGTENTDLGSQGTATVASVNASGTAVGHDASATSVSCTLPDGSGMAHDAVKTNLATLNNTPVMGLWGSGSGGPPGTPTCPALPPSLQQCPGFTGPAVPTVVAAFGASGFVLVCNDGVTQRGGLFATQQQCSERIAPNLAQIKGTAGVAALPTCVCQSVCPAPVAVPTTAPVVPAQ